MLVRMPNRSYLLVFVTILSVSAVRQQRTPHLPDGKFAFNEYSEYPEVEERDIGSESDRQVWQPPIHQRVNGNAEPFPTVSPALDPNIVWDPIWGSNTRFGQVSGVAIDPNGNVAVFHRGERSWGTGTFDRENRFNPRYGPITSSTLVLLDKSGKVLLEWGRGMFYLPHGLTIDSEGNYWLTDVAMHQVFKFNGADIQKNKEQLSRHRLNSALGMSNLPDTADLFKNSPVKPSLVLGKAFVPGNDDYHFCKPTAVAVQKNGDFFVSDGYCNSRVIKFNKDGKKILQWGRFTHPGAQNHPPHNAFLVPHALALAEEHDYIIVADRENGRALCFFASNGTFHKQYQHPAIGGQVFSIAYARDKLYLVNGQLALYSNTESPRVHGYILDIYSGSIISQFAPRVDMKNPHDIAVTDDGREIYVVELNTMNGLRQIYRFLQDMPKIGSSSKLLSNSTRHDEKLLTSSDRSRIAADNIASSSLVLMILIAIVLLIGVSIFMAIIVARCQKRGCLLTKRRRSSTWSADSKDSFRLSSLIKKRKNERFTFFERRPNTRDFSKVNTEAETSDEENMENCSTKMI